jgi:hypothetical protein
MFNECYGCSIASRDKPWYPRLSRLCNITEKQGRNTLYLRYSGTTGEGINFSYHWNPLTNQIFIHQKFVVLKKGLTFEPSKDVAICCANGIGKHFCALLSIFQSHYNVILYEK